MIEIEDYSFEYEEDKDNGYFVCVLCYRSFSLEHVKMHLTSIPHMLNFLVSQISLSIDFLLCIDLYFYNKKCLRIF